MCSPEFDDKLYMKEEPRILSTSRGMMLRHHSPFLLLCEHGELKELVLGCM